MGFDQCGEDDNEETLNNPFDLTIFEYVEDVVQVNDYNSDSDTSSPDENLKALIRHI